MSEQSWRDRLVRAGPGSLSLWQQPAGLGDQLCDFEGFYQEGYVVLLQAWALVTRTAGKCEQDVAFHGRTVFFNPLVGLFSVPLAGHFAVHDDGVKMLREQASLHVLAGSCGDNRSARAREDVAFKLENSLFLFHQQDAAVNSALVLAGRGLRGFGFHVG